MHSPPLNRAPYTVTFVCVQPARPAALAGVVAGINGEKDLPLEIVFHGFESSHLTDALRRADITAAVSSSDLIVLSHIFLDEESAPIAEIVRAHARPESTVVAISSAAPVMRLTRIGRFRMGRDSSADDGSHQVNGSGVTALEDMPEEIAAADIDSAEIASADGIPTPAPTLLKRLFRSRDITPYLKELIIHAPRLLKLLPGGRMLDIRTYLECYLAMIEVSSENLRSMLLMSTLR